MDVTGLIPHIEALIFASEKPLPALEITDLLNHAFGFMEDKIVLDQVEAAIEGVVEKYTSEFYPFEVVESGGGWQFLTKKEYHKTIAQINGEKFMKRLSAAALETLSIIAYKQPVTKGEVEAIRGVSADYAIQKLLEKDLIIISGRNEKMPGHPLVYSTSKSFMDYFGINSSEDLPKIKEVLAEQLVEPTIVNDASGNETVQNVEESYAADSPLAVAENGELVEDTQSQDEPEVKENHNTHDSEEIDDEVTDEDNIHDTLETGKEETPDEDENNKQKDDPAY